MAFDPTRYLKSGSQSPTNNILNGVVRNVTGGLSNNTRSIASNISSSMYTIGSSIQAIKALSSIRTDNIISRSSANYLIGAARNISRNSSSSKEFFSSVNPDMKIAKANRDQETTLIAIL